MKFSISFTSLLVILLAALTAYVPVCFAQTAEKAQISGIDLDKAGKELRVSFALVNCFSPDMEEAVLDGVPTTFRILVSVEKPALVLNETMADLTLLHTIRYNRLNNEFQVTLPEDPQKTFVTKSFAQARKWMSTVRRVPVLPTCWLSKDQAYYLNVKAELSKVELPLIFRYILFWASLWDFETGWYTVEFLY
ncbi:MAG: DUF4390 domain-containing protein [Syntrophobacteraceae bacterium]